MFFQIILLSLYPFSKNLIESARTQNSTNKSNSIGDISDFKEFLTRNQRLYVDKTSFLKNFMQHSHEDDAYNVTVVIKPPGFGKTMLLSTVDYFLNLKNNASKDSSIAGLNIMSTDIEAEAFRTTHMNRYPVVRISFASVNASNFSEAVQKISRLMSDVIKDFSYLLGEEQRLAFGPLLKGTGTTKSSAQEIAYSLRLLCSYIQRHHQIAPIILIDEYDALLYFNYASDFYREMFMFMGLFLHGTLHESQMSKALVTGVTRVDFSKRYQYKVPFTGRYTGDDFGFTKGEVDTLLHRNGKDAGILTVFLEENFGGYTFNDSYSTMLHPRGVVTYLATGAMDKITDVASKDLLTDLLKRRGLFPVLLVQHLLAGQIPSGHIQDDLNHPEIKEDICPFLLYLQKFGFATQDFKVPNLGVRRLLTEVVKGAGEANIPDYFAMTDSLVRGDFESALPALKSYLNNPGDFFKQAFWSDPVEDKPKTLLSFYIGEILYGVELRYDTTAKFVHHKQGLDSIEMLPGGNYGVPIRVRMVEMASPEGGWTKMKGKVAKLMTSAVPKNETEILVQYGKSFVDVCLRRFQGFADGKNKNSTDR